MLILEELGGGGYPKTLTCYGPGGRKKNKCNHKGHLKKFPENVGLNQRQKFNLDNIFHEHKEHFATEKRALLKTWRGGALLPSPPFIRPCRFSAWIPGSKKAFILFSCNI
jgi:hypothetical protein